MKSDRASPTATAAKMGFRPGDNAPIAYMELTEKAAPKAEPVEEENK